MGIEYPFSTWPPFGACAVVVVPNDNAQAPPDLPAEVLHGLTDKNVMFSHGGSRVYVRASVWALIEKRTIAVGGGIKFDSAPADQCLEVTRG